VSAALDRLRALRAQAGTQAALPRPAAAHRPGTAETVADLRRLLRVRAPMTTLRPGDDTDRLLPGEEIAPGLRVIESRLPRDPVPDRLCGAFDRRAAQIATRDVLFFDTETTGLAGGTGTRAFMIGIARWQDDGLHVRQWLMTSLAAERELLLAFADALRPGVVLASYNGKSYDAPLLATRFRLARLHNPIAGLDHIDLLYPTRRSYRGRWENCRLATIERGVLGVVREDDLPGSEAPAAWLGYLRGGSARNLRRVADHNRQDLVSLAGLLPHLAEPTHAQAPCPRC
jgi:uncharacterized protein YprB with RNaseH-like and TPR domain